MTVQELIDKLNGFDPESTVLIEDGEDGAPIRSIVASGESVILI